MKKIFNNILMMAMMATAAVSFTSCDDEEIAYTLEGTWKGEMRISSYYNGITYNSTYTEITFLKDPYTYSSGTGYWADYYSDAPWDYVANNIKWEVNFGDIEIYFIEERKSLLIRDYHLDDSRFWGTLDDHGTRVDFELYHTSSPNWNSYRFGYDSWYNNYYRTRGADGTTPEKPIRFVRPKE